MRTATKNLSEFGHPTRILWHVALGLPLTMWLAAPAAAQACDGSNAKAGECEPAWHPFTSGGQIGVGSWVNAVTVWNEDLIAAGLFETAGGQTVNRIARWDGSEWHPFMSVVQIGVDDRVNALTVWNGDLIAGGWFDTAGGQTVNGIARWDGSEWHPFTSGGQVGVDVNGFGVHALTVWNGDLIAGGHFFTAGGQTVNHIARWDGSEWHPFIAPGGQIEGGAVVGALTVWNGDLIAGGSFNVAGGHVVNHIARWDGSEWHPFTSGLQTGVTPGGVAAVTVWNGDLIAGGRIWSAGGQPVYHIARWDGSAWHPFTSGGQIGLGGAGGNVYAVMVRNGDLIAGGGFETGGGQTVNNIARWDGSAWHPFNSGGQIGLSGLVAALTVWNGDLNTGGILFSAGGQTVNNIARWDGCDNPQIPGDLDGDGDVDFDDFTQLLASWGDPGCGGALPCPADLDGDGDVDFDDFTTLLANWS